MTRFSHSFFLFLPSSKCRAWLFWLQLLEKRVESFKCIVSWLITTLWGRDEFFLVKSRCLHIFFSITDEREEKMVEAMKKKVYEHYEAWLLCKTVISSSFGYSNIFFFFLTYIIPHTTIAIVHAHSEHLCFRCSIE